MLIILSGVAGAGKDTIKNELLNKENSKYTTFASYTSRKQRNIDTLGVTYNFVSKEEFVTMIENNEFYEYSMHHNNYYGTSKKILDKRIEEGKIIVKDIDVNGTEILKIALKDKIKIVSIFLKISSEEMLKRLHERDDKPSEEEIELRMDRFNYEQSKMDMYDYVIENIDLQKTIKKIEKIVEENI